MHFAPVCATDFKCTAAADGHAPSVFLFFSFFYVFRNKIFKNFKNIFEIFKYSNILLKYRRLRAQLNP